METLLQQFSLTLPLWVFLVAVVYLVIGSYSLWRSVSAKLNLQKSSEIKQGFLNKPLLQFVVVFAMAASIAGVVYLDSSSMDTGVITQAEKKIEIVISYEVISSNATTADIVLTAIPTAAGKEWGEEGQLFDIVWTVQAADGTVKNYVEQGRSATLPSNLSLTLTNGNYKVTALVSDDSETYSKTLEIDL